MILIAQTTMVLQSLTGVRQRNRSTSSSSSSLSSEGSIWSRASFLFRVLLCVVMVPLIFPESEALTNLQVVPFPWCTIAKDHRYFQYPVRVTALFSHTSPGRVPPRISSTASKIGLKTERIRYSVGYATTTTSAATTTITTTTSQSGSSRIYTAQTQYNHSPSLSTPLSSTLSSSENTIASTTGTSNASSARRRISERRQTIKDQLLGLSSIAPWILFVTAACLLYLKHQRWRLSLSVAFLMANLAVEEGILDGNVLVSSPMELLRNGFAWYMEMLHSHPLITKSISAGLIGTAGDYTAQWLEHLLSMRHQAQQQPQVLFCAMSFISSTFKGTSATASATATAPFFLSINGNYHVRRGISMFADGLFISGPLMHYGYALFERILPIAGGTASAASAVAAIMHVLADSVFLDSFFVASRFFTTGIMEGLSWQELIPQFKSIYIPSLQASWATSLLLCPLQFSCFRYLPLSFRVLSVNCIDVIWDAVLSFMAHRSR